MTVIFIIFINFQILNLTLVKLTESLFSKSDPKDDIKDKNQLEIVLEENSCCAKRSPFLLFFISLSSLLSIGTIIGLFIATSKYLYVEKEYSNVMLESLIFTSKFTLRITDIFLASTGGIEIKVNLSFSNHRSNHKHCNI